jgi:protein TonB
MSATVHSFPAFKALGSPRSLIIAAIVLLHAAFFWSLTTGLSRSVLAIVPGRIQAKFIEEARPPAPPPPREPVIRPQEWPLPVTNPPPLPAGALDDSHAILVDPVLPPPALKEIPAQPVVVLPQVDARRGISQPAYPAQDVRQGNEGTVTLSVYVLPDGKVGDVRLLMTSGFPRLDASALEEARHWRFLPGTENGTPVAMWKPLPVTFRLVK